MIDFYKMIKKLHEENVMQDLKMETFLSVCEHQNFTKAADALGLTQPAVSRQMKSLETHYGVSLFQFEGKKMSLTTSGEMLYRYARTARSDERNLQKKLKEPGHRPLRLGATPTPGEFMLPKVLAGYLKTHPNPNILLTIQNTSALLTRLDQDEIDLAVVEGNFSKQDYAHLLFSRQNFVPVCAENLPLASSSIEELLRHTLIIREPGSGNREILEHSLSRHNLSPADFAALIETNDIKVQKALTRHGCGIAFLFEAAVSSEEGLRIIPAEGFPLQHTCNIIWRRESIFQEEYAALAHTFAQYL